MLFGDADEFAEYLKLDFLGAGLRMKLTWLDKYLKDGLEERAWER